MSTSYYDVVVVGTELPGLVFAALAARRGYRVLVTGQNPVENRYERGGRTFLRETEFLTGFDTSAVVKQVMSELSMSMQMRGRPERKAPFYQVIAPGGRVDVSNHDKRFARELEREYPGSDQLRLASDQALQGELGAINSFLGENPALHREGWAGKRELTRVLQAHPRIASPERIRDPLRHMEPSHPFRVFWEGPLAFLSRVDMTSAPALSRVRALSHLQGGAYRVDGGMDALRNAFIGKVRQYSCDYRGDIAVGGLLVKRGKILEGVVADRRESIGCDFMVCNGDVKRFFQMIAPEEQKERFHHRVHTLQPSHHIFTVNLVVDAGGIPHGMGEDVFLIGDESLPLEDDNLIHVQRNTSAAQDKDGGVVLTASARLKARHFSPTVSFVQEMTHRVTRKLREKLLPFLDEHLLDQHCPWLSTDPVSGELRYDSQAVRSVYPVVSDDVLGASAISMTTEYKNVLVCNEYSNAGFGLEGAFLSALQGLEVLEERLPLKSPLR